MKEVGNHISDNTFVNLSFKHLDYFHFIAVVPLTLTLIGAPEQGDNCLKIILSFFQHFLYNYPFEMNISRIFFSVKIGSLFKISESEFGLETKKIRASTEMTFFMEVQKPFNCYPQRMNSCKHNGKCLGSFPSCDEVSCKQPGLNGITSKSCFSSSREWPIGLLYIFGVLFLLL